MSFLAHHFNVFRLGFGGMEICLPFAIDTSSVCSTKELFEYDHHAAVPAAASMATPPPSRGKLCALFELLQEETKRFSRLDYVTPIDAMLRQCGGGNDLRSHLEPFRVALGLYAQFYSVGVVPLQNTLTWNMAPYDNQARHALLVRMVQGELVPNTDDLALYDLWRQRFTYVKSSRNYLLDSFATVLGGLKEHPNHGISTLTPGEWSQLYKHLDSMTKAMSADREKVKQVIESPYPSF